MDLGLVVAAGVVIALGLAGTVLPLVPGLPLIWLAGVGSWWLAGWRGAATLTLVLLTALLVVGVAAKYWLPSRAARGAGVARGSLVPAVLVGILAAIVIPVVGFPIGFVGGLYVGERRRHADADRAWASTVASLRAYGLGVLVEVAAGLAMAATWLTIALAA